jgi:hypothetical protein
MDLLFYLSNLAVLPFWALMIFAPGAPFTRRVLGSPWISAPFAVLYLVLFVSQLGALAHVATSPSFASVVATLSTPAGANLAWAHYLTFDLFVGRWIYFDSRDRAIHRALMVAIFLVGLTFGPLAFLLYLVVRRAHPSPAGDSPEDLQPR